jgi:S1-C subfamily serine protease
MELGDSEQLKVGLRVFALGNPFGLFRTMSEGIISSLNRSLAVHENWEIKSIIQIDANINPGNSGGPLLDSQGRLIGMNTAIASKVQQSAGIGFAIPVNLVKRVVPELIEHGRVIRGDIGITHVTVTENGLRIARLTPGGPAEKAGLRPPQIVRQRFGVRSVDKNSADVITAIDGTKVTNASEFLAVIENKKPGDVVELTVQREGRLAKVRIRLGSDEPRSGG